MIYKNIFTDPEDVKAIREAGKLSAKILKELRDSVKEGVSAKDIDDLAAKLCAENGVVAAFKGVEGISYPFPNSVCISVNDEILHGVPHASKVFKKGDVVKVDFGIIYKGFYTDHCVTVGIEPISKELQKLISTAKLCVDTAVKEAVVGKTVGDISFALQTVSELAGFDYVTSYCGHGIGKSLHEAPEVSSFGQKGAGAKLEDGMLLCIENQITTGIAEVDFAEDDWTLKSVDGSIGAMFEHMVIVREGKPEILTLLD